MIMKLITKLFRRSITISLNQQRKLHYPAVHDLKQLREKEEQKIDGEFVSVECKPTELLKQLMKDDQTLQSRVERIQKEFKIYEYFSSCVPTAFRDKHWLYLLRTNDIHERVRYFYFMGLTEQRDANDKQKEEAKRAAKNEKFMENLEKFERGEMVYGAPGYTFLFYKRSVTEFYFWNAMQLAMQEQMPRLLFDCQFLPNMQTKEYGRVLRSAGHAFFTNLESRMALPASFINVNESDPNTKNLISKHIVPSGTSDYHKHQRINPDFYRNDPFHDSKSAGRSSDERDQVIYLSKYATETLKGPLIHKAYILPLTFDSKKETVGAVRRGNYRAMYFPIRDYIEWKCGGFKLAFVVTAKILQEVASNGGDWKSALDLYVPIINRRTFSERREIMGEEETRLVNETREEKRQINEYILQTIGNQPPYFETRNQEKIWENFG
uniref:SAM-dependent MTase TRM10-type domain-containing protein n=1 Tax=Meloidogyne enterolobii TaxID=390850 RepID=A0A6V7TS21_MELEN|nr:unnamed protein product [Meloidogyne enterolobii]